MNSQRVSGLMVLIAVINGYIALDYSAYAGHGELEEIAGEYAVRLYHTSAKYQMWHVFALIGAAVLYELWTQKYVRIALGVAATGFAVGIGIFCYGYYSVPFGGTLTPVIIGAVIMTAGWVVFGIAALVRIFGPQAET